MDDSHASLANYEKTYKEYSAIIKDAHSPILQPITVEKTEIGSFAALQISTDIPQEPGGAETPEVAR